jgi:CheY-like chemotaxis protein/nitrogen-specific signal transduction histidine kinase
VERLNKALNLAYDLLKRTNTELASARREAEEARHLKEQFATHISHELRTPLNIILGFVEIMQRYPEVYGDMAWTPKLRHDIGEIQTSARYLSDLVDDILDLARIEALRMPIRREMTNLERLLHEVRDLAAQLVRDKPTQMRVELHEPLPELYIDRTRIRQVLLNLLANASRFTEQGEIVVRARVEGAEVVVAVSDTGIGIPPEQLGALFAEFRQVESGSQASSRGKGLGLAIARRFVEMHGGHIWAESEVGRGSTFAFTLPIEVRPLSEPLRPIPLALPGTPHKHSLVVIDPDEGASYLRRHLEGIEIIAASDPDEGRRLVAERHPDALLLNVAPNAEGIHQPHPVSGLPWDVPLLHCSLPVNAWLVDHDLFDDWLSKPVTGERLLQTVARYCSEGQILLVDDEPGFVSFVRRALEVSGAHYQTRHVHSGQEAVRAAMMSSPDLILLDIALPDLDGRAVAQALRRNTATQRIPVVAVSGTSPDALRAPARAQDFSVVYHAGFREGELLELIKATLHIVKPRYGDAVLAQAPAEAPDATRAS